MSGLSEKAARLFVTDAGTGSAFLVASVRLPANAAEAAGSAYSCIAQYLADQGMAMVHERIFGSLSAQPAVMAARNSLLKSQGISPDTPVTYIQGHPPWGEGFAGVLIHAVAADHSGDAVWTIMDGDVCCGRGWKQHGVTYAVLQNIHAGMNESRPLQARLMIERAERILREQGAAYGNVVRTWFYLSDIMSWYGEFNKVRNQKYGEFGIMPGPGDKQLLLPASTGIRGETATNAACTMDLIAVIGEDGVVPKIQNLTNHVQLDAFRYGSAFSRAAVIHNNLVEVSGTAAIDGHGVSLYPGDIHDQIECTLHNIEELLAQKDLCLKDICSATVFVKHPHDAEIFYRMAAARGLQDLPSVCVVADVCRDELLFEIDAEAAINKKGSRGQGLEGHTK
jgi:enamine deaminase RidA (YjgF/YER057c/UK114 family)